MKSILCIIFTFLYSINATAEQLITIPVEHRPAEQLAQDIKDFLPKNAVIKAYNQMLIVRAKPTTITEIKTLIEKLDKPEHTVTISVMRSYNSLENIMQNEQYIELGTHASHMKIKSWSTNEANKHASVYQAKGVSGRNILIQLQQNIPEQEHILFFNQSTELSAVATQTRYIDISNGFQAVAHLLAGNKANIAIIPVFSSLSSRDNSISTSSVATVLNCKIGEWVELGRLSKQIQSEKHSSKTYSTDKTQTEYIYLKVDTTI